MQKSRENQVFGFLSFHKNSKCVYHTSLLLNVKISPLKTKYAFWLNGKIKSSSLFCKGLILIRPPKMCRFMQNVPILADNFPNLGDIFHFSVIHNI